MKSPLNNKVVLVNGRDPVLGEQIVRQVLKRGALPCVLQRNTSTGFALPVELVNAEACLLAVRQAVERFGRIDAVVNDMAHGEEVDVYYHVSKAALPYLRSCSGVIVNVCAPEMGMLLTLRWAEQLAIWGIRVHGVKVGETSWWREVVGWSEGKALARRVVDLMGEEGDILNGDIMLR